MARHEQRRHDGEPQQTHHAEDQRDVAQAEGRLSLRDARGFLADALGNGEDAVDAPGGCRDPGVGRHGVGLPPSRGGVGRRSHGLVIPQEGALHPVDTLENRGRHGRVGAQLCDGRQVLLDHPAPTLQFLQPFGWDGIALGDEPTDACPLPSGEFTSHEHVGLDVAVVLDDEFVRVLR